MLNQINIIAANPSYRDALISLLQSEGLPFEDLSPALSNFYMAIDDNVVVGAIGLEIYDHDGLLRSLVVRPEYRKKKIATLLIDELEKLSTRLGLRRIFLLTQTAQVYFTKKGYETIARSESPESIKQSSEFSHTCPSSAIMMQKNL